MPKHFYDSAQTRFWGAHFPGSSYSGANCRGTNKSTQTAGVSLAPAKSTGVPTPTAAAQAKPSAAAIAGIEIVGIEITCDFAERENKIARTSVRSCSPT